MTLNLQKFTDQLVPYELLSPDHNEIDEKIGEEYNKYMQTKVSDLREVENITTFTLDVAARSMDQYNR